MSKPLSLARLLLVTTALVPAAAFAQAADPAASSSSTPAADRATAADAAPDEEAVDISIPGGSDSGSEEIVVTGRFTPNVVRATPQVVSVLSSADIARTGEGDIAGSLQRVTGLSVVGNGFVYVRGLGDRYSLALLNGSPLPSPEPLKRVVPLDIFPTSVIASTLVQKSYSVNFPAEFGGGVINLTTLSMPKKGFFSIGAGINGDTETTGQLGYTYYGSGSDWTGFDDGTRDIPPALKAALNSGKPILEGADFSKADLQTIAIGLVNAPTTLLQRNDNIPANFSADLSGGNRWDLGGAELGLIASASFSNTWKTRSSLQQVSSDPDLADFEAPQSSYQRVITDNRTVVNGLLGLGLEFGEHKIRWTNLYIRDSLKQARLAAGTDQNQPGADLMKQDTAWYERQLINTQLVGEFDFGALNVDLRGSYANSQREAPYERSFTYVRTNSDTALDPTGNRYVNSLGGNRGDASIAFSDLNENLYAGGIDLGYDLTNEIKLSGGYSYSDTKRTSVRREFVYRASALPIAVQQLRPDYLLSDYTIQTYGITLLETSAQDGTAAFDAQLTTNAGYLQAEAKIIPAVTITAGVRYEKAKQTAAPVDLFGTGSSAIALTNLNNDYWLPAVTVTWDMGNDMQLRANASKTIARPQFRELVAQIYQDTDSNRQFRGNPSLIDSRLSNAELRYEWYYARDQRFTAAAFYKKLDNPIETYTAQSDSAVTSSFANAPEATLYGVELEAQKYIPLDGWGGDFFAPRRIVLIGNYTYTQSKLKVGADDMVIVNNQPSAASNFFRDGSALTGQSDHIVNLQLGLEDTDKLSQQTLLLTYASDRITSRGPSGQPDIKEKPGFGLDFVARQGIELLGVDAELKFTARNILGTRYQEYQKSGDRKIFYNLYDVGTSFSLSVGVNF